MISRLGYACIALDSGATTNRTCRLANATPERLRALVGANIAGLRDIVAYNQRLDIRLFRVSSGIIPFGSHPVNQIAWWEEFAGELADIGAAARRQGLRLTMHPGQYTVLSSPNDQTVATSIEDLAYHARVLDALGMGADGKLTIHGGGTYGDPGAAIERFVAVYRRLPEAIARRLILENDERSYSAGAVLEISARCGIPIVFDALHDAVNPTTTIGDRPALLQSCFATWQAADGPPLVHFSSQDPTKQPGAHAEWVDSVSFAAFAGDTGSTTIDCMLEAKGKERALLRLRRELAIGSLRSS
jgi:UV DNA damage endonuclease